MDTKVFTIADELKSLIERVDALESSTSSSSKSKPTIRQNQIIEINSRLKSLENKIAESTSKVEVDLTPLENRISDLENRPIEKVEPLPLLVLENLGNRVSTLENHPAEAVLSTDLSTLESRVLALEKKSNKKKNVTNNDRLETLINILKAEHPIIAKRL